MSMDESVHGVEVGRRMAGDVTKTLALDRSDGGRIVDDLRMKLRNQRLDTPKPPEVFLQRLAAFAATARLGLDCLEHDGTLAWNGIAFLAWLELAVSGDYGRRAGATSWRSV